MKIVFLSFYSGEVFRGVETYVHCLGNELVKLGHDVAVYQNGPEVKSSLYKTITIGIPIDWSYPSSEGKWVLNPFSDYFASKVGLFTKEVIKRLDKNTDILIPTNGNLQSLYVRIWGFLNKKKVLIAGQSGPGWDDRWNIYRFPDAFIALTEYQKSWAKKTSPFIKVVKIPNGANIELFAKAEDTIQLNLPKPIILSVGALVLIKRHELEIEAVSKLGKGSLVISGQGELQETLQKLGDEKLPGRFKIINLPHDQMPSLYHSADLFTFATSPWESFGIVLVEAMASGLPIVASDDPIRKEIVGDAGIFVDPNDSDAYAKAIEKSLKINWKDKSRKQAEKFGWDTIAREYEKLFKSLMINE